MGISSMHIQKASAGSILHNSRENFSHSVVFTDEENELYNNSKEAFEIYRQELATRSEAYSARTKQKLQKNALTQLSAVFNLENHHTLKDLTPLKKYIEKELDTVVYQMAIHRDEGKLVEKETKKELYSGKEFFKNPEDNILYFDKNYTQKIDMSEYDIQKNIHAHFEMLGIDSNGAAIKRNKLSKFQLSKMQTDVAKILEMERGVLGSKAKRRDTHDFKERGSEQQELKITVSKLKQEIETLRKEMASAKQYTKADYQALAKIKKITKKATLEDAVEEFLKFKERIKKQKEKIQELEKEKNTLQKELSKKPKEKIVEVPTTEYIENPLNTELQEKVEELEDEKEKLSLRLTELNKKLSKKHKEKIVKVENPLNKGLQEKVEELEEKLKEEKELAFEAVENQNTFRELAQNYQKKYLKEQKNKKVEYIENPVNKKLKEDLAEKNKKIKELEKEVYSPKYISPDTKKPMKNSAMVAILERENTELKKTEEKYNRLQKVLEAMNKLFKAETYEELGQKVIAMFQEEKARAEHLERMVNMKKMGQELDKKFSKLKLK